MKLSKILLIIILVLGVPNTALSLAYYIAEFDLQITASATSGTNPEVIINVPTNSGFGTGNYSGYATPTSNGLNLFASASGDNSTGDVSSWYSVEATITLRNTLDPNQYFNRDTYVLDIYNIVTWNATSDNTDWTDPGYERAEANIYMDYLDNDGFLVDQGLSTRQDMFSGNTHPLDPKISYTYENWRIATVNVYPGDSATFTFIISVWGETYTTNPNTGGTGSTPVPEPSTLLLLGTGLIGLAGFRRKFRS